MPDDTGEISEEFVNRRDLITLNRKDQPCTYKKDNRDIDVTLTKDMLKIGRFTKTGLPVIIATYVLSFAS